VNKAQHGRGKKGRSGGTVGGHGRTTKGPYGLIILGAFGRRLSQRGGQPQDGRKKISRKFMSSG